MTLLNGYLQDSVLLIDPQWICRNGLRHLIEEQTAYKQVLEAEDIEAACKKLSSCPNIKLIIMELNLPAMDYVEGIAAVEAEAGSIPILAISDGLTRQEVLDAIVHGAAGFVCKSGGEEEILEAITAVESGAIHISGPLFCKTDGAVSNHRKLLYPRTRTHGQTQNRMKTHDRTRCAAVANLTVRQREILHELERGQSNRSIAESMAISVNTVKIHVGAILKVLGVKNRTQAALLAQSSHAALDAPDRVGTAG